MELHVTQVAWYSWNLYLLFWSLQTYCKIIWIDEYFVSVKNKDAVNYSNEYSGPGEVKLDVTTGDVTLTVTEDEYNECDKMGYFNQVSILGVQGGVVGFAQASWLFCSRCPNIYMAGG